MAYNSEVVYFLFSLAVFTLLTNVESIESYNTHSVENTYQENEKITLRYIRDLTREREENRQTTSKPKATKKPSGLNVKQAAILTDGANINKTASAFDRETINPSTPPSSSPSSSDNHDVSTTPKAYIKASGPVLLNMTIPPETEIQISKFIDEDKFNQTLIQRNITNQTIDYHIYYNSSVFNDVNKGKFYWVDMDNQNNVKFSEILSHSHRRAVTVKLSFDFPFYGHPIRNITIATGGFLYTGDYVHSWLAATQYIAPLMANFDTTLSNTSYVKYVDNGTAFTVEWENVILQQMAENGSFTFQCTLFDTGDIVFVYRRVGVLVKDIEDHHHPVKVGLSDAYIIDRTIFFVRRKTIYEYHRVEFKGHDIGNWTVIELRALNTCLNYTDCNSCVLASSSAGPQCNWCAGRCSNGMDRHRQDWLQKGCDRQLQTMPRDVCPPTHSADRDVSESSLSGDNHNPVRYFDDRSSTSSVNIWSIIGVLTTLAALTAVSFWLLYAYRNPHSSSGQFLIRYRPSQWTWKRGEARYTAATIHM